MGLDRDPGTQLALFCYTGYRRRGRRKKRGGEGEKSEKGKKGEGPFGLFELRSELACPSLYFLTAFLFSLYENGSKKASPPSHINTEKHLWGIKVRFEPARSSRPLPVFAASSRQALRIHFTVESRYNQPLYNEVLHITNNFFTPVIVKYMKKNLDITKPRYSEQILPVPWHFVISRFRSTV